jgi:hypothetical protein
MTSYDDLSVLGLEMVLKKSTREEDDMKFCEFEIRKIWLSLNDLVMNIPGILYPGAADHAMVAKHIELAEKLRVLYKEYYLFHSKVLETYTKQVKKTHQIQAALEKKVSTSEAARVAEKRPGPEEEAATAEPPAKKLKTNE